MVTIRTHDMDMPTPHPFPHLLVASHHPYCIHAMVEGSPGTGSQLSALALGTPAESRVIDVFHELSIKSHELNTASSRRYRGDQEGHYPCSPRACSLVGRMDTNQIVMVARGSHASTRGSDRGFDREMGTGGWA